MKTLLLPLLLPMLAIPAIAASTRPERVYFPHEKAGAARFYNEVNISPSQPGQGQVVSICFEAPDAEHPPQVTVDDAPAMLKFHEGARYCYSYRIPIEQPTGPMTLRATATGPGGQVFNLVLIDAFTVQPLTVERVPVAAWPLIILLPVVGLWGLQRKLIFRRAST